MISPQIIAECGSILHRVYQSSEVYLFGSYAWGRATPSSDLDFLVVVEESSLPYYLRPQAAQRAFFDSNIPVPADVIVTTRAVFEERAMSRTNLYSRIKREGILL